MANFGHLRVFLVGPLLEPLYLNMETQSKMRAPAGPGPEIWVGTQILLQTPFLGALDQDPKSSLRPRALARPRDADVLAPSPARATAPTTTRTSSTPDALALVSSGSSSVPPDAPTLASSRCWPRIHPHRVRASASTGRRRGSHTSLPPSLCREGISWRCPKMAYTTASDAYIHRWSLYRGRRKREKKETMTSGYRNRF